MQGFMAVVFNMGLVRKNEFTDYWSTRQSMNILWFCMMFIVRTPPFTKVGGGGDDFLKFGNKGEDEIFFL